MKIFMFALEFDVRFCLARKTSSTRSKIFYIITALKTFCNK